MLYDFIVVNKKLKTPLYRQIYLSIRKSIENGSLKKGSKIPSVRKLSDDLKVSKTTISAAYEQLSVEGYIINKPQSGYYVEAQFKNTPQSHDPSTTLEDSKINLRKYDFSGKSIDENIINLSEWKKCVKEVLNQNYLLTSYGNEQGEYTLRNALQKYSFGTRSVNTTADKIIVGAGTQTLLYILCSIIGKKKKLAIADNSFIHSEFIFKSFDYEICYFECDNFGAKIKSLDDIKPDIILINPNFTQESGANMPINRRLEIINWAKQNNALIIEDDYNGELRYSTHPIPSVQHYDPENTIYIGSFSKVLLPSVRISYMVLPDKFIKKYNSIKQFTNQTSSKTEQLALSKYIESRKIDAHLRKARRIYYEKSKIVIDSIKKHFNNTEAIFNETSLYVILKLDFNCNFDIFHNILEEYSINIMPYQSKNNEIAISFSGIKNEKIDSGIKLLSDIINNMKNI